MDPSQLFRTNKLKAYLKLIEPHVLRATAPAGAIHLLEPAPPRFDCPPDDADWQPLALGGEWGGKQQWACFGAKLAVPADWPRDGRIELRMSHEVRYTEYAYDDNFNAGPEGQVFIDGRRAGAIDREHHAIRFDAAPGRTHDVRAVFFAARCGCRHRLAQLELALVDEPAHKLYHDLRVAIEIIDLVDHASAARQRLTRAVEAAIGALDVRLLDHRLVPTEQKRDPARKLFYASVQNAQRAFDAAVAEMPEADPDASPVVCVGHAHIDLAWLWPISQSRHKCVRTFATQARLLDQHPDWVFNQSSPQAYQWVEEDAPDLFERIAELVERGRWEADGATWCEMDTNVTGGESLVRQLLYGKRYFKQKLGVDSKMLWLPDVFGYSAALPQLLRLAGVDSFVTSKISWSQYNRFPHDTFRWRGIDGSEIATHFITTPVNEGAAFLTYNATLTVQEVQSNWREYRQKHLLTEPLMSFGHGDGGGGPTETMLETGKRLASMPAVPGIPRTKMQGAAPLLREIAERADELPVWDGELYLEYHRGTYTSQGWLKRANRHNEARLHNAEWLASLARPHGFKLDKPLLDSLWHDLMLGQFHDILPGSSVHEVYEEVRPMQARIERESQAMAQRAADLLAEKIDTRAAGKPCVLFNTLSWERTGPAQLTDGSWRNISIPAGGWSVIDVDAQPAVSHDDGDEPIAIEQGGRVISNAYWIIELDEQGAISRLYDRRVGREVLPTGARANQWQVFEDRPLNYDAWDIEAYYREHPLPGPTLASIDVVEAGPVRSAVELIWQMPSVGEAAPSVIRQRLAVYANSPRIDFETVVDWQDHHQLLKVAFPVDVRATEATCQVQFGHVRRPTHRNTSWDFARFEVCAHRFVDLSEHGYGVALLNDCKYGHDFDGSTMRLTCIKAAQAPDALADRGEHVFTYSLVPHAGSFQEAQIERHAAELNTPMVVSQPEAHAGELPAHFAFVTVDSPAVVVDTIKPAEDGEALIVRLYEAHGSHAHAALRFAQRFERIELVDLLEQPTTDERTKLEAHGSEALLHLRPFQVVTLRVA